MRTLLFTLILFISFNLAGQNNTKVDQVQLIKDIQIWKKEDGKMKFSFWIPNSYWRIALEGNPKVSEEVISQIESLFQEYVLICLADIKIHTGGTMTYTDKTILEKSASIIDENGKKHYPIPDKKIPEGANAVLKGMRPMFAQMLGQMGEGMHFFLFKVKNKNKENLINEFKTGHFTVKHSHEEFKWLLPLPSLLSNKYCPVDNFEMKGNWMFCPFHGEKLDQ